MCCIVITSKRKKIHLKLIFKADLHYELTAIQNQGFCRRLGLAAQAALAERIDLIEAIQQPGVVGDHH